MYPAVSSRVLSFFICRTVSGTSYLVADFELECYNSEWYQYLPVALVGLLLYPLGIPTVRATCLESMSELRPTRFVVVVVLVR